jgi:hypothetical protein
MVAGRFCQQRYLAHEAKRFDEITEQKFAIKFVLDKRPIR